MNSYIFFCEQNISNNILKFYKKNGDIVIQGKTLEPLIHDDILFYKEPIINIKDWYNQNEFEELKSFFPKDNKINFILFPK